MATINNSNNSGTGGSNVYRVGDYVYFETQQQQPVHQQQPFQIRRIEELNKTAGGNVEAKVMCFYRRRDLPAQLIALADKHQQQQLSLTLSLSHSGRSSNKLTNKTNKKDIMVDSKENFTTASQKKKGVEEDQTVNHTETLLATVKEKSQLERLEFGHKEENNVSVPVVVKREDSSIKTSDTGKDNDKTVQTALQQQNDWWRSEQLKQRELFLSRQVETLAATHIRGKCTVTLYNETESLDGYLEKDDTFFYCLVFDPVQKTLLADKGEIRVGHKYQAEIPPKLQLNHNALKTKDIKSEIVKKECLIDCQREETTPKTIQDEADNVCVTNAPNTITTIASIETNMTLESDSNIETLIWTYMPQWNCLTDRQIDQFLVVSRSLGTFARALDCTSSVKQPSLHMSAAAASRDITLFHAMDTLHRHGYDLGSATCSLVPSTGPVLCRDEMEEWSASEANLFEEALEKYGKDFGDIRHDFLPWKTHKNIVEYYYMWKTTDRYVQQKRVKAVEQESKLKQVFIPSYNSNNIGKQQQAITSKSSQLLNGNSSLELYSSKNNSGLSDEQLLPGACDFCDAVVSRQWFQNTAEVITGQFATSYHQQNGGPSPSMLCFECWNHWKKYGGPRIALSDKKVITAERGDSLSGDEDRPLSNASSSSTAINMNARSSSHVTMSSPHQQITYQQPSTGSGHLLHQPHMNLSSMTTTSFKCTFIGCQTAPFKSKSQLLRHYSSVHGIGINANNNSSSAVITLANNKSNIDGSCNEILSQSQLQQVPSNAGLFQNSGGPLNLNSSNNSIQQSNTSGNVTEVINFVANSSSPQPQPNNLSMSSLASTNALGMTASGRPVMKTRTAFYLRSTSLAKSSRRRAAQQSMLALIQEKQHKKKSGTSTLLSPTESTLIQPGCLARPKNVARRPFICVPQTAHSYKHECMLSMQHAPVHELRAYLRTAALKAQARRPSVTHVANTLIAARRGLGNSSSIAADLAVPDWLSLPSQPSQLHAYNHHMSSSSKHGKQSSKSSGGGRVAFPKPPKAPDGSLLYERVPNKQEVVTSETAALNNPSTVTPVGLNPATAAAIIGALGSPGSISCGNTSVSGYSDISSNDPSSGFDMTNAVLYQTSFTSGSHKRRLYKTENTSGRKQPQPQVGPPSKRMHRQHHSQQSQSISGLHQSQIPQPLLTSSPQVAGVGAVDGMLASIVAQQQQRESLATSSPLQLTSSGSGVKSNVLHGSHQMQQNNHYRTPSMARTGRKHVISWTDAPDDLYYRCTELSRSLRKARMTGKELRRSARKPWKPIAALRGISFAMPPIITDKPIVVTFGPKSQQPGILSSGEVGSPFDMSTSNSNKKSPSQFNQSSAVPPLHTSGTPVISSRSSNYTSNHH